MPDFGDFLERNQVFAANVDLARLVMPASMPERLPLVLTCADPRVEPAGFLGLGTGDAGVLRNTGGRVDGRVIEDIVYLAVRLGVRMDVAVVHHTQCGTGMLADPAFRRAFAVRTGGDDMALAERAVTDPVATVRRDVAKLLADPLMTSEILASVSGHVLRLETGLVETVIEHGALAGR
ncbi:carbonic anhydrase [Streptomyces sp. NBC_00083]|uniref:carbonic anhydrase n=1 Tax=Streptomyces sp. NBC_00083 TaxID=2975647 RepID=UPI0022566FC5|nr:carbonic anhydrase [Streptomyces sp. NBC_00083]MCX5384699.1 carbonic anhydrase [Streptomyces sp. NBC_00083]